MSYVRQWYSSKEAPFSVEQVIEDDGVNLTVISYGDRGGHFTMVAPVEEYLTTRRRNEIPKPGDKCFSGPRAFIVHAVVGEHIALLDKADGCLYRCHLADYFWNCGGLGYGEEVFSRFAKYEKIENFFTVWDRIG